MKVYLIWRRVYENVFWGRAGWGGGTEISGVWAQLGGLWKIGEVKGKGEYQPSEKQDSG